MCPDLFCTYLTIFVESYANALQEKFASVSSNLYFPITPRHHEWSGWPAQDRQLAPSFPWTRRLEIESCQGKFAKSTEHHPSCLEWQRRTWLLIRSIKTSFFSCQFDCKASCALRTWLFWQLKGMVCPTGHMESSLTRTHPLSFGLLGVRRVYIVYACCTCMNVCVCFNIYIHYVT